MNIYNVTRDYAQCISGGSITTPTGGTWTSAAAIYLGATGPVNGSWLQSLCAQLGVTSPVNGSWVIALANYYSITQPLNGSWWYAIADSACNAPVTPCIWGDNTNTFGTETRTWSSTAACSIPPAGPENWETAVNNWEAEADNWETI